MIDRISLLVTYCLDETNNKLTFNNPLNKSFQIIFKNENYNYACEKNGNVFHK